MESVTQQIIGSGQMTSIRLSTERYQDSKKGIELQNANTYPCHFVLGQPKHR